MAIFEKTIRNKTLTSCFGSWKMKFQTAVGRQIWRQAVISKRAMPGAVSGCLNGTA